MGDDLQPVESDLRVSDRDRDRTVEQLRQHVSEGRLTLDEFADRVGVALVARTAGELQTVVSDLPASPAPATRTARTRRWVVAVMSGAKAKGRWRAGSSVTAVAVMGGCEVDLRRAEMEGDEVRITAVAFWGGIDIIVPEGIEVELVGLPVMGGKHMRIADVPVLPGSPVVRVRAFPIMGGVSVRSKPDRHRPRQAALDRSRGMGGSSTTAELASALDERPEGTVTIMFSDIAGYSALTERLGDLAAHELLRAHNAIVREQVASCDGREVKTQGDGFMVAFSSATRALRCACAIQRAFEKYSLEHPEEPIRVHVGLHTGEPIHDGSDLLGRTVIVASRLTDMARPGEILVSSLLHDLTESTGEFRYGDARAVELDGMRSPQTVYRVDWQA